MITVDANEVLEYALARSAQDYAAKIREIALLEARIASLTRENDELRQRLTSS